MFDGSYRVDPTSALPRHAQVQNILRALVETGRLRPGDKIPAEVQIADALGVSKMTVNKALLALTSEGLLVREVGRGTFIAEGVATPRARNVAEVSTADFRPQGMGLPQVALSFVEGTWDVLGNDYYGTLYQGIAEYFAVGTDAPKATLRLSPLAVANYVAEDQQVPADGRLIIAPRADHVPSLDELWQRGKAAIVIGASWPLMSAPCVDSDNIGAAALAVRHLMEQGHQRIAILYAEPETANTQDRILGYRRALSLAGVPHDNTLEVEAYRAWKAGDAAYAQLQSLMAGPEPITAIFAAGYYLALEAFSVVYAQGLRIPQDVSVIGFDDPTAAPLTYPPLTTMRQPLREMGYRAAERLMALMNGQPRELTRDFLMPQLILRRSTGPVPDAASRRASG